MKNNNLQFKNLIPLLVFLFAGISNLTAQTTFAAGEIAITGYQADTPDKVSLLFLKAVDAGTTFTVTDNGWMASGSFRTGEGVQLISITQALPCGTEVLLELGPPAFQAFNDVSLVDGTDVGQITSISGSIALSTGGDQFFVYQGAVPAGFITGIQMNSTGWEADATSSNTSALPATLMDGVNAFSLATEVDNAAVDCASLSTTTGDAATLSAAIYTSTWTTSNSSGLTIPAACAFMCDLCSPPTITCPADNFMLPPGCNPIVPAPDTSLVVSTDGCGIVVKSHVGDVMLDVGCSRTITRTYRVTDDNGDFAECDQTFTFTFDPEGPTLSEMPGPLTVECDAVPPVPMITATDNCAEIADVIFINEIHYDNAGGDVGEFFEIAGTAGFDLSTCQVVLYNGSNGDSYNTIVLTGSIDNEGAGFGAVSFPLPSNGLQNGAPDGLALVCDGEVIEFLSYEGTMTANNGPAAGMMSTDIGVEEEGTTPIGQSLQKTGEAGCAGADFTWVAPMTETPGTINTDQSFNIDNCPQTNDVPVMFMESFVAGACPQSGIITRTWTATDACGTVTTHVQMITIEDNTPPTFCDVPMSMEVTCELPEVAMVTAIDNCDFGTGGASAWINEIHYDNAGGDVGEFFEIAGTAGFDLSNCQVVLYNGSNGNTYNTIDLSGTIDNEGCGYGALNFSLPANGLQNGAPDGLALVCDGVVVEFLSYEGTMTANNGPALGMTSTDVGVSETSATPIGNSIQLTGMGGAAADFVWAGPDVATPGDLNNGQTIATPDGLMVTFMETGMLDVCAGSVIMRTWTATDACGNSDSYTQTITVLPAPGPSITCPADEVVTCFEDIVVDPSFATASASCGEIVAVYVKQPLITGGLPGCDGTVYTYIYKAVDECGRTAECEQQFLIQNNAPTVTVPAGGNVECFDDIEVSVNDVTVDADCLGDNVINVLGPVISGPANCPGSTYTYTYRVKDACNRIVETERVFTIQNFNEPVITSVIATQTTTCLAGVNPNESFITYDVACGADATVNIAGPQIIGAMDCNGTLYRYTYTVTDACGRNSIPVTLDYVVQNEGPVFAGCEDEQWLQFNCEDYGGEDGTIAAIEAYIASVSASSACGNDLTVFNNFNSNNINTCLNNGINTITFRATDNCGRTSFCTTTYVVVDTEAPTIFEEAQDHWEICNYDTPANFDAWVDSHGGADAYDACSSENVFWSTIPANPSFNCMGAPGVTSVTVTFRVRDNCGNISTTTATFNAFMSNSDLTDPNNENVLGLDDSSETTIDLTSEDVNVITPAVDFVLYQNQPNPFKNTTMIGFNLPEAGAASLEVFDVSGRLIYKKGGEYAQGYNQVNVNRSDLPVTGILYYRVNTATDSQTKKMILLD